MKKYMASCVLASAVLLLFAGAAAAQYGAQPYGSPAPYGQPQPYGSTMQPGGMMPASVFAGLVAAYEEHARWWSGKGVNLTPHELPARSWGVRYSQPGPDRLSVLFLPQSPSVAGGGVEYIVDLRTLQIVGRNFER